MTQTIRWGIIGVGAIAADFAQNLSRVPGTSLTAVAARSIANAKQFAQAYGAGDGVEGAEALIARDDIDIVYVASPSGQHAHHAIAALNAGKAALIEKPFAPTAKEGRAIAEAAKAANTFCMEAMWMRFHPLIRRLKDDYAAGAYGTAKHFVAEAGYRTHPARLTDGDPGRGAILNFGSYTISLAHFLFGTPGQVSGQVRRVEGLDRHMTALLHYDGFNAVCTAGVDATLQNNAVLTGETMRACVGSPFFDPTILNLSKIGTPSEKSSRSGKATKLADELPFAKALKGSYWASLLRGQVKTIPAPAKSNGLYREALEATECVRTGRTQSEIMPLADSIAVLETLDAIAALTP